MNVISVYQSRQLDLKTINEENIDIKSIIYKAANAVYEVLKDEYAPLYTKKISIVCGKGHNGADGLALALILKRSNLHTVILMAEKYENLNAESAYYYDKAKYLKADIITIDSINIECANEYLTQCDIIVDALLGTGLNKDVSGIYCGLITLINIQNKPVISIDIPSGICGDSGLAMKQAVKADIVVVMQYLKYGNILNDADDYSKRKIIKDISLKECADCRASILSKEEALSYIKVLNFNIHKYNKGNILVFGGSKSMEGSAVLAASAAYRNGAGLVHIAALQEAYKLISIKAPIECMVHEITQPDELINLLNKKTAIAAGMGLGNNKDNLEFISILLSADIPLVLDAGAFGVIAQNISILKNKKAETILTPHTKELSVLMNCSVDDILQNPINAAQKAACEFDSVVVLKMNKTIIADPIGEIRILDVCNNGMATAGSGDVLTGIITSSIKYSDSLFKAACAGVYIHSAAGIKAANKLNKRYMIASDIISSLSEVYNEISEATEV